MSSEGEMKMNNPATDWREALKIANFAEGCHTLAMWQPSGKNRRKRNCINNLLKIATF
jgi:hypothetical protein